MAEVVDDGVRSTVLGSNLTFRSEIKLSAQFPNK